MTSCMETIIPMSMECLLSFVIRIIELWGWWLPNGKANDEPLFFFLQTFCFVLKYYSQALNTEHSTDITLIKIKLLIKGERRRLIFKCAGLETTYLLTVPAPCQPEGNTTTSGSKCSRHSKYCTGNKVVIIVIVRNNDSDHNSCGGLCYYLETDCISHYPYASFWLLSTFETHLLKLLKLSTQFKHQWSIQNVTMPIMNEPIIPEWKAS